MIQLSEKELFPSDEDRVEAEAGASNLNNKTSSITLDTDFTQFYRIDDPSEHAKFMEETQKQNTTEREEHMRKEKKILRKENERLRIQNEEKVYLIGQHQFGRTCYTP